MIDVMIIGGGGHAVAVFDVLDTHPDFNAIGFVDKDANAALSRFGMACLGSDDDLKILLQKTPHAVMGLGQIKTPQKRVDIGSRLLKFGASLPAVISPKSFVSRYAAIDDGTTILHQVAINAECRIGKFNILNTGAIIEHGAATEDYVHIAPGAIVLGDAKIGMGSFIGAGAVIRESVTIGGHCVIGAGVTIRHNLENDSVVLS